MFEQGPSSFNLDSLLDLCKTTRTPQTISPIIKETREVKIKEPPKKIEEKIIEPTHNIELEFFCSPEELPIKVTPKTQENKDIPNISVSRKEDQIIWL